MLYERAWALLAPLARRILLALSLFATDAGRDALARAAGLDGVELDAGLGQLIDLALIERIEARVGGTTRYGLHPLTRLFATGRLASEPPANHRAAGRVWLTWCVDTVRSFGYSIADLDQLDQLDYEADTIFAAVNWAASAGRHREVIALVQGIEFYCYVRALWGRKLLLHQHYIAAARAQGDADAELAALALHIQLLSRQHNFTEAER